MKVFKVLIMMFYLVSCSQETNTKSNLQLNSNDPQPIQKTESKDSILENAIQPKATDTVLAESLTILDSINEKLWQFDELKTLSVTNRFETNYIIGDFYGDDIEDIAALVEKGDQVGLCIINQNDSTSYYLFKNNDHIEDYRWAGVFKKVPAGNTLWSNYIDDFRDFKDVPDSEKVVLEYDALFVHAQESCGGGFIFWKDNKFNWLQQE
ncbi:MAG: hypothetical protein ACPGLV_04135 [Bacteroidia bacterium]